MNGTSPWSYNTYCTCTSWLSIYNNDRTSAILRNPSTTPHSQPIQSLLLRHPHDSSLEENSQYCQHPSIRPLTSRIPLMIQPRQMLIRILLAVATRARRIARTYPGGRHGGTWSIQSEEPIYQVDYSEVVLTSASSAGSYGGVTIVGEPGAALFDKAAEGAAEWLVLCAGEPEDGGESEEGGGGELHCGIGCFVEVDESYIEKLSSRVKTVLFSGGRRI